jgi:putative transcriptional regulator
MSVPGLRQGLLLAMPPSSDPNLSRAVVLVIRHDEAGSFGLVLNRPSTIQAGVLFDNLGVTWRGPDAGPLYLGGPVAPQQVRIVHETRSGAALAITPQLALSTNPRQLHALALDPPRRVRILVGSLDWAPGQLAAAMSHGSLYSESDLGLVLDTPADTLWDRLQSIGTRPATGLVAGLRRRLGLGPPIPKATLRRK